MIPAMIISKLLTRTLRHVRCQSGAAAVAYNNKNIPIEQTKVCTNNSFVIHLFGFESEINVYFKDVRNCIFCEHSPSLTK
jgi:hypothetical protein